MQIPRVENFLCCLELRTGGLVCGWLGMVGSVFGAIITLLAAIFGQQLIKERFKSENENEETAIGGFVALIIVFAIIMLIMLGIYFYCSWKLLKGTKNVSSFVSV